MTRPTAALLLLAAALSALGCSDGYETAPAYDSNSLTPSTGQAPEPTTDSPTPSPQESSEPRPTSGQSADTPAPGPAESPAMNQPAETPPPTAAQQPSIRLSAGVALPQSLPTGTAMGFSVDYRFSEGSPSSTSPYAWVIQPSKGQKAIERVRLSNQGTLQSFFQQQFRPENGPFTTHIEDANGNRLSPSLPLR
jgi:hypothetical protein